MITLSLDVLLQDSVQALQTALDRGASPAACVPPEGLTPLGLVMRQAGPEALDQWRVLCAAGAPVDALDERGFTAMHQLLMGHVGTEGFSPMQMALLGVLLETYAERGWALPVRPDGRTLLHTAAVLPDAAPLAVLVAAGVPVNATDARGNTALHSAYRMLQPIAAGALLGLGADPTLRNAQGQTPEQGLGGRIKLGATRASAFALEVAVHTQVTAVPRAPRRARL